MLTELNRAHMQSEISAKALRALRRVVDVHLRKHKRRGVQYRYVGQRLLIEIDGRERLLELANTPQGARQLHNRAICFGLDAALKQLRDWGLESDPPPLWRSNGHRCDTLNHRRKIS